MYADDEPRDDRGRWTAGGGGGDGKILKKSSSVPVRSATGAGKTAPYTKQLTELPAQHAIITAENPGGKNLSPDANRERNQQLRDDLLRRGYTPTQATGVYTDKQTGFEHKEHPFVVEGMPPHEAEALGRAHGQNGVVTHLGYHDLVDNKLYPTKGVHEVTQAKAYTELPGGRRFMHDINFDAPITLKGGR